MPRILVVDDELNIIELAKLYLEREGYQVEGAANGNDALSKQSTVNPDIIILGGGVSQAGDLIFEPVREVVAGRIMRDYTVSIVPAALGDDCGLLGAAALVLGEYK